MLEALASKHPLPDGWTRSEVVLDKVVVDALEVHRVGLSATSRGQEANGSAAGVDASPVTRAYFELFERASTLLAIREPKPVRELWTADRSPSGTCGHGEVFPESDDPTTWRHARSNGVAVHVDWGSACERAYWELAERDRVLRAWFGEIVPEPLDPPLGSRLLLGTRSYEWLACRFPAVFGAAWSEGIEVVGVYGFPREPHAPLISGYGARPELAAACASAVDEALQLLAFLWGETIPDRDPPLAPSPLFHLERFLVRDNHVLLRRWLEGEHVRHAAHSRPTHPHEDTAVHFVDLTPEGCEALRVAKALSSAAVPLTFGQSPFGTHLPPPLRVHPIA
jgi:ribosomal protein S12 methylthiotransferase accessory factor YcaO